MPYLTPDPDPADPMVSRVLTVPASYLPAVAGALWTLAEVYNWEAFGQVTPADAAALMASAIEDWYTTMPNHIGTLVLYATPNPPAGALAADGTIYDKAAYPQLAAALGAEFEVSSTQFRVPDYTGRAPAGGEAGQGMGDHVGAASVNLTTAQLPSHNHSVHSHGIAINIEEPVPGAPYPLSTPELLPGSTGNTGSGDPVDVRGPRTVTGVGIWAV